MGLEGVGGRRVVVEVGEGWGKVDVGSEVFNVGVEGDRGD